MDDGKRFEGPLGGSHPREEMARFYRNRKQPPHQTGFRAPEEGSPFIHENIFYRCANPEVVKRIAQLLESEVDPADLIRRLDLEFANEGTSL